MALVVGLAVSIALIGGRSGKGFTSVLGLRPYHFSPVEDPRDAIERIEASFVPSADSGYLFSSEPRVAAIGSGYPIPFSAESCPFTGFRQPRLDQLDHDADGISDAWEQEYGFDHYQWADAELDPDGDFFTNREEFRGGSNPLIAASRPSYAHKLRFLQRKEVPFPLVFKGFSVLADGHIVFQIYMPATSKTVFAALGDEVEGIALQRFEQGGPGDPPRLIAVRGNEEIVLVRGEVSADPESQAELINMLDRSTIIVTMGPLLSLYSDEYTVLRIEANSVSLRDIRTGEVFDIVGLAEE